MLENDFLHPSDACRGTDFWMLNDALDDRELVRQMHTMREHGVASVIARTYIGLRSDYPGKDWMHKMHIVVDEAEKLGMTIFLQAGYMPEAVLNLPEEYSLGAVGCFPKGEGTGEILDSFGPWEYRLNPTKTILDMLSPEACAFYVRQSYEEMWKDFRDAYGKAVPSMWVDEPSYAKATLPWTKNLPKAYQALWGEEFPFASIHLLFADGEGDGLFRVRFWRTVLHLMKNAYFRSVRDWGHQNGIAFSGHLMAEDTMESQIRATCFTMPMYKYFDIPGIDYLTASMDWRDDAILPTDPWSKCQGEYGPFNTPLQCSSAAHQAGRNVILAEMYGVSVENMNFRDQKYMFDHFASLGINHRSVHGMFYSLRGRGKRAYPPHVLDYQPYWEKYGYLADTVARESAFLRAGKPFSDMVLIHPMETAFSLYHAGSPLPEKENHSLKAFDRKFNLILRSMLGWQTAFELGDEDTIAEEGAAEENGLFRIGQMTYRTVILPPMTWIRETTLRLLQKYLRAGGRVIVLERFPTRTDSGAVCGEEALAGAVFAPSLSALKKELDQSPRAWRFQGEREGAPVQILCRRDENRLNFFILNRDCHDPVSGTLILPGEWRCRRFEAADGGIRPESACQAAGETRVEIRLAAGEAEMLECAPGGEERKDTPARCAWEEMKLTGGWRVERENPNGLLLEMFRFARGDEALSAKTYPILTIQAILLGENYTGPVTLETSFRTAVRISSPHLSTECPEEQEITLDGRKISSVPDGIWRCHAFKTLPLPDLAPGEHVLRIHRHFEPQRKPVSAVTSLFENLGGVELEPMTLLGDFAVSSAAEPPMNGCVRLNPDFTITEEKPECVSDLITAGYPFYCGNVRLRCAFRIEDDSRTYEFSLGALHGACAEVLVNGVSCGILAWAPFRLKLKGVKRGENELTIRLFGTLRNALGPWHRPSGAIGSCWAGYAAPNQPWEGAKNPQTGVLDPTWFEHREDDTLGWTESYLLLPFGIEGAAIRGAL